MNLIRTATYLTLAASAVLFIGIGSSFAQDEQLHICEVLMKQEHTEAEMEKCIKEFGEPESFKRARESRRSREAQEARTAEERAKYYDKVYTAAELKRFGAPYVARRSYYDVDGRIYKTKVVTDEKALCKYLGFEKNLGKGGLSDEMEDFNLKSFVGLVVTDPAFGAPKAEQFRIAEDELDPSNIQVYTSLTCRRDRKEGDPESGVIASVEAVNIEIRKPEQERSNLEESRQNSSSRRNRDFLDEDSPYLYKPKKQDSSTQR